MEIAQKEWGRLEIPKIGGFRQEGQDNSPSKGKWVRGENLNFRIKKMTKEIENGNLKD